MRPVDILLIAIIALVVGLTIRSIIKRRKAGGCAS